MAETWEMFGYQHNESDHWLAVGPHHYVRFHGCRNPAPVIVTEDPEGTHLGWITTDETEPVMIQRQEIFEIQFPYGSNAEVEAGKDRVVRLSIRVVP